MIFPIIMPRKGVDEQIGTAVIEPNGSGYSIMFYLIPGHRMSTQAQNDLEHLLVSFMQKKAG